MRTADTQSGPARAACGLERILLRATREKGKNMTKYLLILSAFFFIFTQASGQEKTVEVKKVNGRYMLYRHGSPFYIKGAGGYFHLDKLKECGGNSVRIWGIEAADYVLEEAQKHGLTVMLGLDMGRERQGFDYNNTAAVKKQLEDLEKVVIKYKDHPALLMWAVGNEVEHFAKNEKVWDAMREIIDMVHRIDPNHPVTTMLAGVPRTHVRLIIDKCPNIDILSFNAFKDLPYVPRKIRDAGWQGPYIITEWGSSGYWESDLTDWKVSIEETSAEKAERVRQRYVMAIKKDSLNCLGSYVFYWGQRQERTHTFLSMFLESGEKTAAVDMMQFLWTSKFPANRAPLIHSITIDGKKANDNIYMDPGSMHKAAIMVVDPENETLSYRWEVYHESTETKVGGDKEAKPAMVPDIAGIGNSAEIFLMAPVKEGPYRLFVYVFDGSKNAGTANIPFYVKGKKR